MADVTNHEPHTEPSRDAHYAEEPNPQRALSGGTKERYVLEMFSAIAPRYDRMNAILSFRQHTRWRRLAVRLAEVQQGDTCLDICTGTGDFAVDLAAAVGRTGRIVGADFCEPMIRSGLEKVYRANGGPIRMMVANVHALPYTQASFDAVTVGFGIRNVSDIQRAVDEMARVTAPGGRVVILEFNRPLSGWYRPIIDLYLFKVLPRIGGLFSKREAYTYLPESMKRFISRQELTIVMERAGLSNIRLRDLNFGTVCIHIGTRQGSTPGVTGPQPT